MTTMKSDGKPGFNAVHVYPINPKALSLGELYGEYNLSTGEWLDGVISSIMGIGYNNPDNLGRLINLEV